MQLWVFPSLPSVSSSPQGAFKHHDLGMRWKGNQKKALPPPNLMLIHIYNISYIHVNNWFCLPVNTVNSSLQNHMRSLHVHRLRMPNAMNLAELTLKSLANVNHLNSPHGRWSGTLIPSLFVHLVVDSKSKSLLTTRTRVLHKFGFSGAASWNWLKVLMTISARARGKRLWQQLSETPRGKSEFGI